MRAWMRSPALLFFLALLVPAPTDAQARVVSIVEDSVEVDSTTTVEWLPFGQTRSMALHKGQVVDIDDELRGTSDAVIVDLACSDSATAVLSGAFRALVQPPDGDRKCVLRLLGGAVDVAASESTAVEFGGVNAGSEGTQYRVVVSRAPGNAPTGQVVVFEGAVRLQTAATTLGPPIAAGSMAVVRYATMKQGAITTRELDAAAHVLASLGGAEIAVPERRRQVYSQLRDAFKAVLKDPRNTEARLQLGAIAARNAVRSRVALYEVQQVNKLEPTSQQAATAHYFQASILRANGDSAGAAAALEWAVRRDTSVASHAERVYNVPITKQVNVPPMELVQPGAATAAPALVATLTASPSVVRAGDTVRVFVTARTAAGKPVPYAGVNIRVGGGQFLPSSGVRVEGRANEAGNFLVLWSCRTACAPAYTLAAVVTHGSATATARARVQVTKNPGGAGIDHEP